MFKHNDNQSDSQLQHARSSAWVMLTVLSGVALAAHLTGTDDNRDFRESWSLVMILMSLVVGAAATVFHVMIHTEKFISSIPEIVAAIVAVLAWIMGLPVITSPDNRLAVRDFAVIDANLYFSSWGAFIAALYILVLIGKEKQVNAARDAWAKRWLWVVFSSLVAMSSASRMFQARKCSEDPDSIFVADEYVGEFQHLCKDLKVGISLSVISVVLAILMTVLTHAFPEKVPIALIGMIAGCLGLVLWSINIAYLTFGNGPASSVGNLFFSTWISFVLVVDLAASHAKAFLCRNTSEADDGNEQGIEEVTATGSGEP